MAKEEIITIKPINVRTAVINIVGDGDLVLNKMNDPTVRALTDARKNKAKTLDKPDEWEQIITSMHWRDGAPKEFSEESLKEALKNNAPCISAFGLKKSFMAAVVRNNIDTYSTKFDASMNIVASNNLIPIKFAAHNIDEKLMSPKKGAPVLVHLNRFTGWSAEFTIQYVDGGAYGLDQIVNIMNLAGFGLGIGSGRTSGYGRYHVENVI